MPEPNLLQRQRQVLRAFRRISAQRAQAEAAAAARQQQADQAAAAERDQVRQTATAQLQEIRQAQERVRYALSGEKLEALLDRVVPATPAAHPLADPAQELGQSMAKALDAAQVIQFAIDALRDLRRREAELHRRRIRLLKQLILPISIILCASACFLWSFCGLFGLCDKT